MRPRKEKTEDDDQDRDFVVALARGLDLLRAFRREGEALGNRDLAERSGLSKSTVSRLTYTLHKLGYLTHNPDTARYSLGTAVLSLGFACLAGMPLRQLARPFMQELASQTTLPVAMAGRDGLAMVYLERCKGTNPVALNIEVGAQIKLATTAVGRAYLAALDEAARARAMDDIRAAEGVDWPRVRRGIEAAVDSYQSRGFCLSIGEWRPDVAAVAVPYVPRDGSAVLSFNCGGSVQTLSQDYLETQIAPALVALVARVAAVAP